MASWSTSVLLVFTQSKIEKSRLDIYSFLNSINTEELMYFIMFTDNSTSREILTCSNFDYCVAENGLSFNIFVCWGYIWRCYNLLQIKRCWCCPGCQLCGYKCDMQISCNFERLLPASATKLQTTAYKYHTSEINVFKCLPGFFISALHVLCQKREDAAKAFFLEDKICINNPLMLSAVHTTRFSQVWLKMQADRSNL